MQRRFQQVDVFSSQPFSGNPLAVVVGAEGLSTESMQRFARWTNLSETTFLLPATHPEADYSVRIFTLSGELPFAGHPTLGSCHAWLTAGGKPRDAEVIVQECKAGLVRIRRIDGRLAFAAPPLLRSGPVDEHEVQQIAAQLQILRKDIVDAQWADNGPGWVAVLLKSAQAVLALEPAAARERTCVGVAGPYPAGAECAFEVRTFFTDEHGVMREDPVTGSFNASLAQWLLASGRTKAPYVASQGTRLGRSGRARIHRDAEGMVWVAGDTLTCIAGEVDIRE